MHLTCHCGKVTLVLNAAVDEVGECNCSICRRYAALWAYFSPDQVQLTAADTEFYCWGDQEVEFHRCKTCGCLTHYITTDKCSEAIFAVNMRLADTQVLSDIRVRKIDNASL